MPRLTAHPRAFTLIEMLMLLAIIVMVAFLVLPSLEDDRHVRVIAAARMLGSDVELAQVMTIANPQKPIVVCFQPTIGKYWLAPATNASEPINRPGTLDKYIVQFGQGLAAGAEGVTMQVEGLPLPGGDTLTFNAQGGVNEIVGGTTGPSIRLVHGDDSIKLSVSPITGAITETTGG